MYVKGIQIRSGILTGALHLSLFFIIILERFLPLSGLSVMVVPTALCDAVSENKQLEIAKAVFQSPLPAMINYSTPELSISI